MPPTKTADFLRGVQFAQDRAIESLRNQIREREQLPPQFLRDADGFVHTPNGHIAQDRYNSLRDLLPDFKYPAWESIPLMTDLTDADLKAWYGL